MVFHALASKTRFSFSQPRGINVPQRRRQGLSQPEMLLPDLKHYKIKLNFPPRGRAKDLGEERERKPPAASGRTTQFLSLSACDHSRRKGLLNM